MTIKVTEADPPSDEPLDLRDKVGVQLDHFRVLEWTPPGGAAPTEVHVMFELGGRTLFAVRLKSADAVDRLIATLRRHRDGVWGSDAT